MTLKNRTIPFYKTKQLYTPPSYHHAPSVLLFAYYRLEWELVFLYLLQLCANKFRTSEYVKLIFSYRTFKFDLVGISVSCPNTYSR